MALHTDTLEVIAQTDAHEGPVYAADERALYFTSLPVDEGTAIRRLDLDTREVTTVVPDANRANGMTMDQEGRLVICEQGGLTTPARITRLDRATLARETLAEHFEGRPLNSPNDVVVARDGAIWFTDPSYGHLQGFRPEPALPDRVYRLAGGRLEVAADGFDKPNGLAFSADERTLFVTDSGTAEVIALDANGRRRLATTDLPDGVVTDAAGRIYVSSSTGVAVFDAAGAALGEIPVPGAVNFAWGGASRLYITTDTAVWAAELGA
jgi:gluconolactonase